MVPGV